MTWRGFCASSLPKCGTYLGAATIPTGWRRLQLREQLHDLVAGVVHDLKLAAHAVSLRLSGSMAEVREAESGLVPLESSAFNGDALRAIE